MRKAGGILLTAVLAISGSAPVNGQIVTYYPLIAWTGPTDCGQAPQICEGGSHIPNAPASFDAFVYMNGEGDEVEECALGVTWPADWSVVPELCAGSIVEGSIDNLRDGIRVVFAPCAYSYTPFLHLRIEATSAGRIQAAPGVNGAYGSRRCGGNFESYWQEKSGYVDVGNVCGGVPMKYPCDFCTIYGGYEPSATFDPPSWEVTVLEGETTTIPVHVSEGGECQHVCGGKWTQYCNGYPFLSQVEWLTIELSGDGYDARVDASNLPPGVYYGGGEVEAGSCCRSECWPVELTVVPPTTAVEQPGTSTTTWGQIKAVYR